MGKKKVTKVIFIVLFFIIILTLLYLQFFKNKNKTQVILQEPKNEVYSSNKINDVKYTTKDNDGNEYTITASGGEIDYSNPNIIYLTKVKALIKLLNSEKISIISDYGKYNSDNFDTIFSKNVKINYLDNKITGEYLDFSLERNSMLISRKVVYTNPDNIMEADVVEMDIQTKETKIFMLESDKKVNIKSKN
ncbi:LPS export ABC transporter periplasmic protein LptC [Candidatus Pelagibacter sp.]|nr:LPS export ABC transporter periplasmic protein LptC [Candidatus Pelagibacter sp.]